MQRTSRAPNQPGELGRCGEIGVGSCEAIRFPPRWVIGLMSRVKLSNCREFDWSAGSRVGVASFVLVWLTCIARPTCVGGLQIAPTRCHHRRTVNVAISPWQRRPRANVGGYFTPSLPVGGTGNLICCDLGMTLGDFGFRTCGSVPSIHLVIGKCYT